MLKHPNLFLVENEITTFKYALKWVQAKCYINEQEGELVRIWTVEVLGGRIVSLWRCSKEHTHIMAHSRLPFVIEERDGLFAIYQVKNIPPYLLDLKHLDEDYGFTSKLTSKEIHLQQMKDWSKAHKEKLREYHRKRYLKNKYPLNGGCPES
jgi:hypothetical protein